MNVTAVHRDHDELLIVRAAAGDADPVDAPVAQSQLGSCPECRALYADVTAIRNATTASVLRVPARPRSFRIDPDVLERQRMPTWRRLLSRLGSPRYDVLRPLAGAVAGIGLAVMVATSVGLPGGLPAAAPVRDVAASPAASQGSAEVYAAPSNGPAPAPAATSQGDHPTAYGPSGGGSSAQSLSPSGVSSPAGAKASGDGAAATGVPEAPAAGGSKRDDSGGTSSAVTTNGGVPIGLVGAVLLLAGAGVFLLQTAARRTAGR